MKVLGLGLGLGGIFGEASIGGQGKLEGSLGFWADLLLLLRMPMARFNTSTHAQLRIKLGN